MKTRIIKQLNTEKTHSLEEKGIYTFVFSVGSRKLDIKKVIEKTFSVKVDEVRVLNTPKKVVSFHGKQGFRFGYKKVYVRVANGMKITVKDDVQ